MLTKPLRVSFPDNESSSSFLKAVAEVDLSGYHPDVRELAVGAAVATCADAYTKRTGSLPADWEPQFRAFSRSCIREAALRLSCVTL
jgi:hypothetical protein